MSSQQPPIYYFFNIGFNSANWSSMAQGGLSQGLADQYYLGRLGTPTSIATNTTFTGTTDINGVKTPTIESKTGTVSCTSNLTLSNTTATVNNLICNNRIYQRSNLNTDIYSNASWMRQIQLLQTTGAVLTPVNTGYQFEYNILPQGSARYGTQTIPANSMLRGDIFKLTVQGRYAKGAGNYIISYNTTNVGFLMGGFNDTVNSTVSEFYNIEVTIQLRTDPGIAGMVAGTFSLISGNIPQFLTNTGVPFNTTNPQTFIVTVVFNTLNVANLFATNFSNLQTM